MLFFVFFKIIKSGNKYENFLIQITNVKIKRSRSFSLHAIDAHSCSLLCISKTFPHVAPYGNARLQWDLHSNEPYWRTTWKSRDSLRNPTKTYSRTQRSTPSTVPRTPSTPSTVPRMRSPTQRWTEAQSSRCSGQCARGSSIWCSPTIGTGTKATQTEKQRQWILQSWLTITCPMSP